MRPMHPCAVARFSTMCSNMICTSRVGLGSATRPWLRTARYWAAPLLECIMMFASSAGTESAAAGARALADRAGSRVELGRQKRLGLLEQRHRRVHGVVL